MFYVKAKINDTVTVTAELHDDNVFCECPECGREVEVDIAGLFRDGEGDLYSTSVLCDCCSKTRLEVGNGQV